MLVCCFEIGSVAQAGEGTHFVAKDYLLCLPNAKVTDRSHQSGLYSASFILTRPALTAEPHPSSRNMSKVPEEISKLGLEYINSDKTLPKKNGR